MTGSHCQVVDDGAGFSLLRSQPQRRSILPWAASWSSRTRRCVSAADGAPNRHLLGPDSGSRAERDDIILRARAPQPRLLLAASWQGDVLDMSSDTWFNVSILI